MADSTLVLQKNKKLYTHNSNQSYWILKGSVDLFIVPWQEEDETDEAHVAGQAVRLCTLKAEDALPIPAFSHTDMNMCPWRFYLQSGEDGTTLEVRGDVTKLLCKRFLQKVGIDTYEKEGGPDGGFENSLIAYYNNHLAQDARVIHQGESAGSSIRIRTFKEIESGLSEGNNTTALGSSNLYKVVLFAARKCGITHVAQESQVRAAIGPEEELTISEIARVSHFICREITLDMDWYENDCGVIIATLNVEGEKKNKNGKPITEKHLVTCFPKSGGYQLYDGQTEHTVSLTAQLVAQLEPKAFSIRRALPRTTLGRKELLDFVKKSIYPRDIAVLLIISIISTLIGVLIPKLNQMIYDDLIPLGNYNLLVQLCAVIAACMIGNVFISIVKNLQEYRIPCRAGYELQDALYQRMFELPESFFRKFDSADLAQRIMGIGGLTNTIISKVVVNAFSLAVSLIYLIQMFRYSWKLALAGLAMLIIYGGILYVLSLLTLRNKREAAEQHGNAVGKLYQFLGGIDKIRMAGAEERTILEYTSPVVQEKRLGIRINRVSAIISVLIDAGSTIFSMVLYFMMIKMKLNVTVGAFMAFTSAYGSLTSASMSFVQAGVDYNQLKPEIARLRPVIETVPENDLNKDIITELKGEIRVQEVTFAYDKSQSPVLNKLNIHILPGEYVAIVGSSGCGKSTLLKLLLGFEQPDSGQITYDGKDIASIDKHSLRKQMGVVLQNGRLISGSIYENISIASAKPDIKKVWQVVDDVGLRADIEEMPMGLHTVLSEAGNTISGGQQQRILIARAIYNDPAVLFFDEATSALDNITQSKVCASLDKRHMTRVVIAHRLSTVRNCDRIIVLDHGHVIEEGNFDALMALHGRFYEMARRQLV